MVSWITKQKGWLGPPKKKDSPLPVVEEPKASQNHVREMVITHISLRCPYCKSKKIKCYGADNPVKYYRCLDCKRKFRVIEKAIPI